MAKPIRHPRNRARSLRGTLTAAELILWSRLRRNAVSGCHFRRQHPIGPYIADFACLSVRLVIELEGATHGSDVELAHDACRDSYLRRRDFVVLRFWNHEIYENLDGVLNRIWDVINSQRRKLG
jgi:very-short-patch-repair endonuclease